MTANPEDVHKTKEAPTVTRSADKADEKHEPSAETTTNAKVVAETTRGDSLSQQSASSKRAVDATANFLNTVAIDTEYGAQLTYEKGRLAKQSKGDQTLEFSWKNGAINTVKDKDGVWQSDDGVTFKLNDRERKLQMSQDGSVQFREKTKPVSHTERIYDVPLPGKEVTENNSKPYRTAAERALADQRTLKSLDLTQSLSTLAAVDALGVATGAEHRRVMADQPHPRGTANGESQSFDRQMFKQILDNKTQLERSAIDAAFANKYGRHLEDEVTSNLNGNWKQEALNVLNKSDGSIAQQRANRIDAALSESENWWNKRSNSVIEKDIRDTLAISTSKQIEEMDATRRSKHSGQGMLESIKEHSSISPETKAAAEILMSGLDKRTDAQTLQLADNALKNKNLEFFKEAMTDASPSARDAFFKQGGEEKMRKAFAPNADTERALIIDPSGVGQAMQARRTANEHSALQQAQDYARHGGLDVVTQVKENTGAFTTNAEGVNLAIRQVSDEQSRMFSLGRRLAGGEKVEAIAPTDQDRAKAEYERIHAALTKAGNPTEVLKWEDQIATKGGSFISDLAKHRGTFVNSNIEDIKKDIAQLSQEKWTDAVNHPERRRELANMLGTLNKSPDEIKSVLDLYDQKVTGKTPADWAKAKDIGVKDLPSELSNASHWYGYDQKSSLDAVLNMTATERERYKTHETYQQQVDGMVKRNLTNDALLDSAQKALEAVKQGRAPELDLVGKLNYNANFETDHFKAIKDIQTAFAKDPSTREKINNPKTEEEKKFAQDYKDAVRGGLGASAARDVLPFRHYADELLKTGTLSLDSSMDMYRLKGERDISKAADALLSASPDEKSKLETDQAFKSQILRGFSPDEKAVLGNALQQGKLNAEDLIQDAVTRGAGEQLLERLKDIKREDLPGAREQFAAKYHKDFDTEVRQAAGSGDRFRKVDEILGSTVGMEERFDRSRSDAYASRSGIGSAVTDSFSATGIQVDNSLQQANRAYTELQRAAVMSRLDFKQQNIMANQVEAARGVLQSAIGNHAEAKETAATYLADGAIAAVGVGSVIASGGTSIPLITGIATASGAIKVGAKAAMMGKDYEATGAQLTRDFTVAATVGAASVLGPAEIAAVLGVGKKAAGAAVESTFAQVGAQGINAGAREEVRSAAQNLMQNALSTGASGIDRRALDAVAEKAVAPELTGQAREDAVRSFKSSLERNMQQQWESETRSYLKNLARTQGLTATSGFAAGATNATVDGIIKGQSPEEIATNVLAQGIAGTGVALGAGGLMKLGGRVMSGAAHPPEGAPPSVSHSGPEVAAKPAELGGKQVAEATAKQVGEVAPIAAGAATAETAARTGVPVGGPHVESVSTAPKPSAPTETVARSSGTAPGGEASNSPTQPSPLDAGTKESGTGGSDKSRASKPGSEVPQPIEKPTKPAEVRRDVDGREVGHRTEIENRFPAYANPEVGRATVSQELDSIIDGSTRKSVLSKLEESNLAPEQKTRVMNALAEVREHYSASRVEREGLSIIDKDQRINWDHTKGEFGKVLDASKRLGLSPAETEDALLASMFSDSVKHAKNFATHHLDGALAADVSLKRMGLPNDRVERIVDAIREHQISPPKFMAMIYGGMLKPQNEAEKAAADNIKKYISDPMNAPYKDTPNGRVVALSDEERAMFKRDTGNEEWYLPRDGSRQSGISDALRRGDGDDNYRSPRGAAKIVEIRGPETAPFFADKNLEASINSVRTSEADDFKLLTDRVATARKELGADHPNVKALESEVEAAKKTVQNNDEQIALANGRVESWLKETLGLKPTEPLPDVPFFNSELKYPNRGENDANWWNINRTPESARTEEQQAFWKAHRYDGLSASEIDAYNMAIKIRARMAQELRRDPVTGEYPPGDYKPVMTRRTDN